MTLTDLSMVEASDTLPVNMNRPLIAFKGREKVQKKPGIYDEIILLAPGTNSARPARSYMH
jgi:hypothetical protein